MDEIRATWLELVLAAVGEKLPGREEVLLAF